jgi:hypothetical protein
MDFTTGFKFSSLVVLGLKCVITEPYEQGIIARQVFQKPEKGDHYLLVPCCGPHPPISIKIKPLKTELILNNI